MKVGVLTSSRADYGIYRPLLKAMANDNFFDLHILAFGTHLSKKYGCSINRIKEDGFDKVTEIDTIPKGDNPKDIVISMGKTVSAFSHIWHENCFDLVFAIGDRFEMFAAVSSSVPFNIKIAHLHGGETTLGAIDNVFRHSITSMSKYHYTAAEPYKQRVTEIIGSDSNVFNVGALSIDNICQLPLYSKEEFNLKYNIDLSIPTILITFHPETVQFKKNKKHVVELIAALKELNNYQFVITMPNADTMGLYVRQQLENFIKETPNSIGIESFGVLGYLSCMKHCHVMLGNTSSGFIEAAGLNKPVVNLGNRQKGRILTSNIFQTAVEKIEILKAVEKAKAFKAIENNNIYGNGNASKNIISSLKNIFIANF